MKKAIILLIITLSCSVLKAQQKKLATETTFKLTDMQIIDISTKIDSLKMLLMGTSTQPANEVSKFISRVDRSLAPFWKPIMDQMVMDTVKNKMTK